MQQPETILARAQVGRCTPRAFAHIHAKHKRDQQAIVATLLSPQSLASICCLINLPCSNSDELDEWSRCQSSCDVASHQNHPTPANLQTQCHLRNVNTVQHWNRFAHRHAGSTVGCFSSLAAAPAPPHTRPHPRYPGNQGLKACRGGPSGRA